MAEGASARGPVGRPQPGVGVPCLVAVLDEELADVEEWDEETIVARLTTPWIESLTAAQLAAVLERVDALGVNLGSRKERLFGAVQNCDNRTIYTWFDSDVDFVAPPADVRERTSAAQERASADLVSDGAGAVAVPPPPSASSVAKSSRATSSAGGVPWIFQPRFIYPWSSFGDDTHEALDIFKSTLLSERSGNPELESMMVATEFGAERETPVQSWTMTYHQLVLKYGLHPVIGHVSQESVTLGCSYSRERNVRLGFGLGDRFVDGETRSEDDDSVVASVECKRTFTMPWTSIINEYERRLPSDSHETIVHRDEDGNLTNTRGNVIRWRLTVADPLGQLVMYMVMSGCKFGMLTNSYRTFFVRLGNRPRAIYVTDAFYPEQDSDHSNPNDMSLGHATLLFYAHALAEHVRGQPRTPFWNWFGCPGVKDSEGDTRFDDTPQQDGDEGDTDANDTSDVQTMYQEDVEALWGQKLHLTADDGSGVIDLDLGHRYWIKREGIDVLCHKGLGMTNVDVDGRCCFLKSAPLDAKTANRELLQEAQVYDALKNLQGSVLPILVLHGQDAFYAIRGVLTTQEGVALSSGTTEVARRILLAGGLDALVNKIERALRQLHGAGYLHGDVALRNIVINESGEVKLIDLGRASKLLSPGEAADELKIVETTLVPQLKNIV